MKQGWEFALWFFLRIAHFLGAKELNTDSLFSKRKSLTVTLLKKELLFKKERQSEEQQERFALGHKNGKRSGKTVKYMVKTTKEPKSVSVIHSKKTGESLTSLFVKELFALVTLL